MFLIIFYNVTYDRFVLNIQTNKIMIFIKKLLKYHDPKEYQSKKCDTYSCVDKVLLSKKSFLIQNYISLSIDRERIKIIFEN